jgi:lysozyme family protein
MNENFDRCFNFIMQWEGGYSHDPDDPGGETNFGISKRAHPDVDIKNLTRGFAMTIYKTEYWFTCNCQSKPWPWDLILFDTAVNLGTKRALVMFQENPDWKDYLLARIRHYIRISAKTHDQYLRGWINRVLALNVEALRKS